MQTPEDYAREHLEKYLVAKGITPAYARKHIEERVTEFDSVTINGRRLLLVKYDGRLWPTFNDGVPNPYETHLADLLWIEIPYEARHPLPGAPKGDEAPEAPHDDSPYLEDHDPEEARRRRMASRVGEFL